MFCIDCAKKVEHKCAKCKNRGGKAYELKDLTSVFEKIKLVLQEAAVLEDRIEIKEEEQKSFLEF